MQENTLLIRINMNIIPTFDAFRLPLASQTGNGSSTYTVNIDGWIRIDLSSTRPTCATPYAEANPAS